MNQSSKTIKDLLKIEDSSLSENDRIIAWRLLNGKFHRKHGPAVHYKTSGLFEWWINGDLHREDGPARVWNNGDQEYWIHGEQVTKAEFLSRKKSSKI